MRQVERKMDAATKKFWSLPELGERLVSFLDPLSVLHLVQSRVMEKETLQRSLTSKEWSKLIRLIAGGEQTS